MAANVLIVPVLKYSCIVSCQSMAYKLHPYFESSKFGEKKSFAVKSVFALCDRKVQVFFSSMITLAIRPAVAFNATNVTN